MEYLIRLRLGRSGSQCFFYFSTDFFEPWYATVRTTAMEFMNVMNQLFIILLVKCFNEL